MEFTVLRWVLLALVSCAATPAAAQSTETLSIRGHAQTLRTLRVARRPAGHRVERRRRLDPPRSARRRGAGGQGLLRRRLRRAGVSQQLHLGPNHAAARGRAGRLQGAGRLRGGGQPSSGPSWSACRKAPVCRCWRRPTRRHGRRSPASSAWACRTSTSWAGAGGTRSSTSRTACRTSRRSAPRRSSAGWRPRRWPPSTRPTTSSCRSPRFSGCWPRRGEPKQLWVVKAADHRFSDNLAEFDQRLVEALTWIAQQAGR